MQEHHFNHMIFEILFYYHIDLLGPGAETTAAWPAQFKKHPRYS